MVLPLSTMRLPNMSSTCCADGWVFARSSSRAISSAGSASIAILVGA